LQPDRRSFFVRLLGLAAIPVAAKVAAALPAEAPRALGGPETSLIDQTDATALARAWMKGLFRIEPYVPREIVYGHYPPFDYFFFRVDRGDWSYVGGDETIAVRKSDGRVSNCGMIGE
jgi:hypothetical protein